MSSITLALKRALIIQQAKRALKKREWKRAVLLHNKAKTLFTQSGQAIPKEIISSAKEAHTGHACQLLQEGDFEAIRILLESISIDKIEARAVFIQLVGLASFNPAWKFVSETWNEATIQFIAAEIPPPKLKTSSSKIGTALRQSYLQIQEDKIRQNKAPWKNPATSLHQLSTFEKNGDNLTHIGAFSKGNAGDHLLPIVLRDLFDYANGPARWQLRNARPEFLESDIDLINQSRGLIIGGGGLFLRDTNANPNSGWQWNCSIPNLQAINVPIVLYAVGYNRFRDQPEFEPIFTEHITALAKKATYIGLRNHGSIQALKRYLPETLHTKIRYQPCMTTVIRNLYPELCEIKTQSNHSCILALNTAFDRPALRFKGQEIEILTSIAQAAKALSQKYTIHIVAHGRDDLHILPFLRGHNVSFEVIDLHGFDPQEIIQYYSNISLSIGMRGHAQMIPFGCGTPILSLISHDKMKWFLEDINHVTDWGIEISSPRLRDEIVEKAEAILNHSTAIQESINKTQNFIWEISLSNAREFRRTLNTPTIPSTA